jgi:hypothetical protein
LPLGSQQPTPPSTLVQVSGPPLEELEALALALVLVVLPPLDDDAEEVDPPPRHSTLQLAWRHCPSEPRATLLLQDVGGLALPRQLTQAASPEQACASAQQLVSRQLLQVASLDERPHPAVLPLEELPLVPLVAPVVGPPLVAVAVLVFPVDPPLPAKIPLSVPPDELDAVAMGARPPAPLPVVPPAPLPVEPPAPRLLTPPAAQAAARGTRTRTERV